MTSENYSLNEILRAIFEPIIHDALRNHQKIEEKDHLLDAEEAAKLLCVSEDWLYRNSKKLPFTRKLGPKMLRFSYQGILKFLQTRKA